MKGCFSGRNVEESAALLQKFDELRNQLLINHAVDETKKELNPKVLDSLDKIDNIKMQVIELKKQINRIDMKRAEVVCVDKIRSLSERKLRRDAHKQQQAVLETLRSRQSRKSRKSKKRKSRSKKRKVRSKSRASRKKGRSRSQVRFARCVACPERGYNLSGKSKSKSKSVKLRRSKSRKSKSRRSSKFASESNDFLDSVQLKKLRLRRKKKSKSRKSKSIKSRKSRTKSRKSRKLSRSKSRKSSRTRRSRSKKSVKPFTPLVDLKPGYSYKQSTLPSKKRKRSKSASRMTQPLHSESTNRENIDINILSRKQSSKTGILKNSHKNSIPSTRQNMSSNLNYLNYDDILNFAKTNPEFNRASTKSARFADQQNHTQDLIKTLKISSTRKNSIRGQVETMCDEVTQSMRKHNIKSEIKVLDQEILDIGKELEQKIDYVKCKMTRKLRRRGLKI